jgi:hypothetical protein
MMVWLVVDGVVVEEVKDCIRSELNNEGKRQLESHNLARVRV